MVVKSISAKHDCNPSPVAYSVYFEFVSYLGERVVLCVGNG